MNTIYLSGPMTGLPKLNYPLFNRVAAELRKRGFTVINPAENVITDTPNPSHADYMRLSLDQVEQADTVATLPNWEDSPGALEEVAKARRLRREIVSVAMLLESGITQGDRL